MSYGSQLLRVHADTSRARRAFRKWERSTLSVERRVLGIASKNVKTMYCSGLKGKPTKAGLHLAPLDKPWRKLWGHGAKMGGVLSRVNLWRVRYPNQRTREVDIVPGLQPYLARWQFGDRTRPAWLRGLVTDLQSSPQGRQHYYKSYARRPGWPRDPLALPPVPAQPVRDVVDPVSRYADRHMAEWYAGIWRTMQGRG